MPLGSSNPVGTVKPLKHGKIAPKWTNRGRTHPFLIVLKYKVADLVFFSFFFSSTVQSNPDSIGKKRGVGRRDKTSLVREVYEMERGGWGRYLKIRTKDGGVGGGGGG